MFQVIIENNIDIKVNWALRNRTSVEFKHPPHPPPPPPPPPPHPSRFSQASTDLWLCNQHCNDVIMGAMASQITSLTIVDSTVYSDADQRKYQSSTSLAFVRGIHRWPVNSPHKWPVTREMFPFDNIIMIVSGFVINMQLSFAGGLSFVSTVMIMTHVCLGSGLLIFPASYNYAGGLVNNLLIQVVSLASVHSSLTRCYFFKSVGVFDRCWYSLNHDRSQWMNSIGITAANTFRIEAKGINRWPVHSPHTGPVMREVFHGMM